MTTLSRPEEKFIAKLYGKMELSLIVDELNKIRKLSKIDSITYESVLYWVKHNLFLRNRIEKQRKHFRNWIRRLDDRPIVIYVTSTYLALLGFKDNNAIFEGIHLVVNDAQDKEYCVKHPNKGEAKYKSLHNLLCRLSSGLLGESVISLELNAETFDYLFCDRLTEVKFDKILIKRYNNKNEALSSD